MTSSDRVRPASVTARGWGWRHAGRSRPAVHGLDLDIRPGERVLLLGPSGAGKSTLLHALAGVLGDSAAGAHAGAGGSSSGGQAAAEDPDESGSLLIDGAPPRSQRGQAGLVQQDPETQVVLSRLGDDVAFGAENLSVPREEIWKRVHEALDDVGLAHLPLDHPTSALSGGQKQRLALAGILAMRPGLILLDEPTANLDPAGVLEVRDAVGRCLDKTGATLVVVEHRVAVWRNLVDRIVVLQPGSSTEPAVLIDGTPDRVLEQAREMLIAAGVWVPGYVPPTRERTLPASPTGSSLDVLAHPSPGSLLLAAENLAVSRERPRRRGFTRIPPTPVQSGITAQVRAGQALTVTGPNGAGKSTFALTLAGLLQPVSGSVSATLDLSEGAGIDPYKWKAEQLIARIGTVFQEPEHQFVTGRVLDELMFGPRHLGHGEERVDELLERLRLSGLVDANPYTLSGGEKRRLSVATVLAAHPQVLVLDEPTFGQDANTWAELASFLSELLDAGTAVVSVTHDQEFTAVLGGTELKLGMPEIGLPEPALP